MLHLEGIVSEKPEAGWYKGNLPTPERMGVSGALWVIASAKRPLKREGGKIRRELETEKQLGIYCLE